MSNISNYNIDGHEASEEIILKWYRKSRERTEYTEVFIYAWISFNALYEATTIATHDSDAWKEFIKKEKTKEMWNSVKNSPEIERFLEYLKDRKVYDKSGNEVQTGGLYDMKHDAPYKNWDFGDDLNKYIGVIYRIRNNLFHGGKRGDDSDKDLIRKASESFLIFLDKLYGMLHLSFPNISLKDAYADMLAEWKQSGEFELGHVSPGALFRGKNFEEFLQIAEGDLTDARNRGVPATLFFLMDGDRILGGIQIRHSIDHPNLRDSGGHIGYGIRPSERRKGYATEMLTLALVEARKLGLDRVMLGCNDGNIGSIKTIEKNGGVFERYTEHEGWKWRVYWIDLLN